MSKNTCSFNGCDRPSRRWNLCEGHSSQQRRGVELSPLYSEPRGNRIIDGQKLCVRCGDVKSLSEYWFKKEYRGRKSSVLPYCKTCTNNKLREWCAENYERSLASARSANSRRRAAEIEQSGYVPDNVLDVLIRSYGSICMKPGCYNTDPQIDHVVPLTWGDRLGRNDLHDISNMQLLCRSCNSSKGNRTDDDYRPYILNGDELDD